MTDLMKMTPYELEALEVRTTCHVLVNGKRRKLTVYWLDLLKVKDEGKGRVVDPKTGTKRWLTWDEEEGYIVVRKD